MRFVVVTASLALAMVAFVASPALAEEKKKKDPNFDDLFGAPPAKGGGSLDAMKKATEGVTTKTTSGTGLQSKVGAVDNEAGVTLLGVFAAETITQDKKLGCQPAGRAKQKLAFWSFDETPAKGAPFEVCLTLASKSGREMNMSLQIVDSRNQRVARAEDVIDFRGRPKIDHVLAYPAPVFKLPGQYFYVIDLDGKEVGRMPLFVVKVEGATSGVPGNSATPEPGTDAPVTAKEPDGT